MTTGTGLRWQIEGEKQRVELVGEITEETDFGPLTHALGNATTLDLSQISRINSCGVREWLVFMESLKASGKKVVLERCSVPFVAQLNMISNFRGHAEVRSVFAPYYCPACEAEQQELIPVTTEVAAKLSEAVRCHSCGAPMEFDDFPESFLRFHAT